MNRWPIYVLSILLLAACKNGQGNYPVEDSLYNCEKEYYKSIGIDIDAASDSLQAIIIRQGIMKDCSGESILNLWAKIETENDFPTITDNSELLQKVKSFSGFDAKQTCPDIKDELFEDSTVKLFRLMVGMLYIEDVSPHNIARLWLNTFTADDFEHPFYKWRFLWVLYHLGNTEEGLKAMLPPLPDSETDASFLEKENVLQLFIHQGDSVLLNNSKVSLSLLKKEIKNFILDKENKGIISIKNQRGTSYSFYLKVLDLIREVYAQVRDEYAIKTFGSKLNKLTDEQQQKIRDKYPQRISEAEPQNQSED